jgi:hypothetical protein
MIKQPDQSQNEDWPAMNSIKEDTECCADHGSGYAGHNAIFTLDGTGTSVPLPPLKGVRLVCISNPLLTSSYR